jgi:hypothetical protein
MKIKPQNLLRSLLAIPYLGWGIALLFVFAISTLNESFQISNSFLDTLQTIFGVYAVGIILWGIPYTLLALGLLVWSLKKSMAAIFKVFLFSPVILALLMAVEAALVAFLPSQVFPSSANGFLSYLAVLTIPALAFGYTFILVAAGIYKALSILGQLKTEIEANPIQPEVAQVSQN